MTKMRCKTKGNTSPQGKSRVYFTCHAEDFENVFDQICSDIFKTHDCAIYYTEDMDDQISEENKDTDLGSMNLMVIPITKKLLTQPNRAMDYDFPYAIQKHIPVLPIMLEADLDYDYGKPDKFGELQYLSFISQDETQISYEIKLKQFLNAVLISNEMAQRIRAAFDAYIFLSYRKKDRRYANELMKLIHSYPECRDIAIWYDEFLTPGESFNENIHRILNDSKLFTLLVTPSLLEEPDGKPNFVMGIEYPTARKMGMDILPAEMENTDKNVLREKYQDIPACVSPYETLQFQKRLTDSLLKLAITENDRDPVHNYLIGLAYLDGIDVEVDRERALKLITSSADADLPEAMEKLIVMYTDGIAVMRHGEEAKKWSKQLAEYYYSKGIDEEGEIKDQTLISELFSHYSNAYWNNVIKYFLLKVDRISEAAKVEKLYRLLMACGILDYTLLFETSKNMTCHQELVQMALIGDILEKSINGTYPSYGPLFWYVPEYDLYEMAILSLKKYIKQFQLVEHGFAKALALVRDVCFIFSLKQTLAALTKRVDGLWLYEQAKAELSGIRGALCELFCLGHTDYIGGDDIYPRCFNVAEARLMMKYNCGIYGVMNVPFADELGLFDHEAYNEVNDEYIGVISCPYDIPVMEKILGAKSCRKVSGLILSSTKETMMMYISMNSSHIRRIYLPENCTDFDQDWKEYFGKLTPVVCRAEQKMHVGENIIYPVEQTNLPEAIFSGCQKIKSVIIPETMTKIEYSAFSGCENIVSVHIPESVTEIEPNAWRGCVRLSEVYIPDSVTKLGSSVFSGCKSLVTVHLPKGLDVISRSLFYYCENLMQVEIPEGVTVIEREAFEMCTALKEIKLPESVKRIDSHAFKYCTSLSNICIPDGMEIIDAGVFNGCSSLTSITLPNSITVIRGFAFSWCTSLEHINLSQNLRTKEKEIIFGTAREGIGENAFYSCTALKNITIPDGITVLEGSVFEGCTRLESITIPESVTMIKKDAFKGCSMLTEVVVPEKTVVLPEAFDEGVVIIGGDVRSYKSIDLVIQNGEKSIKNRAYSNNKEICSVCIPESVTYIGDGAFENCTNLKQVVMPEKITLKKYSKLRALFADRKEIENQGKIGGQVFEGCVNLESIRIPEGITEIGFWTFKDCLNLKSVVLPNSLTHMGEELFLNCSSLSEIHIPDGVKAIPIKTFSGCSSMKQLVLPNGLETIGKYAFEACEQLTEVLLPDSITSMNSGIFARCKKLTAIKIPNGIEKLEAWTFVECESLTSVFIPENIKELEQGVFAQCENLISVNLPKTLTAVNNYLFESCHNLKSIEIPENVQTIGNQAFAECEKLTHINIPKGVTIIGTAAFRGCHNLKEIRLPEGLISIDGWAFIECEQISEIEIPDSVRYIGELAFAQCKALNTVTISRRFEGDITRIFGEDVPENIYFV